MKTIFLLLLFFCNSIQAQYATSNSSSVNQIKYFKSGFNELLNETRNRILDFNGTDSVIFSGENTGSMFGTSVSSAGDVNGDGYPDLIMGAPQYSNYVGRAYIFFGGPNMDTIADVVLTGEVYSLFGFSVSGAGDVNGDGFSDVIIGAYGYNNNTGKAYIYYGGSNMNNVFDVTINGNAMNDCFGVSVSEAGDVNADGYSDVIIGANLFSNSTGRAYLFFGSSNMNNIADIIMTGESTNNIFGWCVSGAGDVNGDGYSDVIISAYGYASFTGRAYIYFGGFNMNNVSDVILDGENNNSNFGASVSSAGDINGDGYSDVIIGANAYDNVRGRAYIYYGNSNMDNIVDIILTGKDLNNSFGITVSNAGDINTDGYSDIIVGADNVRKVFIYYGGQSMNNEEDITFSSEPINNSFGHSVSCIGDINGDGFSDVIVGAPGFNNNTGRAFIYILRPYIKISLKILIEGMYYQFFNQMIRKDTVKVCLRNATSPYAVVDSAKGIIDSLSFSNIFSFINAPSGTYYIVVKHFNSIETWSKSGGESMTNDGLIYNYDFTTSASQAYGNNLKLKGSKYCIISGDVDRDGYIDASDASPIDNDSYISRTGRFLPTDLNGDSFVDADDMNIQDNNRNRGVIQP